MSGARHKLTASDISALAAAIHYPECWDTAAYPDLMSALREVVTLAGCSVCEPRDMLDRENIELRRKLELTKEVLGRIGEDRIGTIVPYMMTDRKMALLASETIAAVREPAGEGE